MSYIAIAGLVVLATLGGPSPHVTPAPPKPVRLADVTCFKTGEMISGMNKICYYNCLGSTAAITIGSIDLCPLSIER
jgi:hypothetical protein